MMTKICCKCKIEQPLTSFSKDLSKEDAKSVRCKTCSNSYWQLNKHRLASNKYSDVTNNATDEDLLNQKRKQFLIEMVKLKASSTRLP